MSEKNEFIFWEKTKEFFQKMQQNPKEEQLIKDFLSFIDYLDTIPDAKINNGIKVRKEDYFGDLTYLTKQDQEDNYFTPIQAVLIANNTFPGIKDKTLISVFQKLLDKDADINLNCPKDKEFLADRGYRIYYHDAPIQFLCDAKEANFKLTEFFLDKGANVESKAMLLGDTPILSVARSFKDIEYLKLFLKYDADINAENKYGENFIHSICHNWQADKKMLVKAFDIAKKHRVWKHRNKRDKDTEMNTPLAIAIDNHVNADVISRILIESKIDLNIENSEGHSPLMLASFHNSMIIAKLLLKHGAKFDKVKVLEWLESNSSRCNYEELSLHEQNEYNWNRKEYKEFLENVKTKADKPKAIKQKATIVQEDTSLSLAQ